ncbi:MAG: ABC transporter permease, partial [Gemmatimonadales bacterium]
MKSPAFTAITVLTLGLGMGAVTAIFSVVDGVLLESLPYPNAERLVSIQHNATGMDIVGMPSARGLHVFYSEASRSFDALSLYSARTGTLTGLGDARRISTAYVTPSLFDVLSAQAAVGRVLTDEEGVPGGPAVVVLSDGFWSREFGRDQEILGRTVQLDGTAHEVVGVMPPDFAFPDPSVALWVPLRVDPAGTQFGGFNYPALARVRQGVTPEAAQADLNGLVGRFSERFPEVFTPERIANAGIEVDVHAYIDDIVGEVRPVLWVLLATVGFVLLIACANVANLLLVRAESRSKEVAIRAALGASRDHLMARYFTESLLLAVAGSGLGLLVSVGLLDFLVAQGPRNLPRLEQIGLDSSVLAFTAVLTLLVTLVFGAIPALRNRRASVAEVIRDSSRGNTAGRQGLRARSVLVVGQVAFAMVLLVGSGLTLKSFWAVQQVEPGFEAADVLSFYVALPESSYPEAEDRALFHQGLLERLEAMPGVRAAGVISRLPLWGMGELDPILVDGQPIDPDAIPPIVEMRAVSPGYFKAMGIELQAGRMLTQADADTRSGAVMVSRQVERAHFGGLIAVGGRVAQGLANDSDPWSDVVGVVEDVHNESLTKAPIGTIYYPLIMGDGVDRTYLTRTMGYTVRTAVEPTSLVPAVRGILAEMDPSIALADVSTMAARVQRARAPMAFTMLALGLAAVVGLLLGAIGLYGVVSHVTGQRTQEIGVRMALGADNGRVRRMVVAQGMGVTAVGLVVGLGAAFGLSRFMQALLFQVEANDAFTFTSVAVAL